MLVVLAFAFAGCSKNAEEGYSSYKPILMERAYLEHSVKGSNARDVNFAGKIASRDNLLFVAEQFQGLHIFDNTNPAAPKALSFITVPGLVDFQIKGNNLFANNGTDLVCVNFDDPQNVAVTGRVVNAFPVSSYTPDSKPLAPAYAENTWPKNTILVGWEPIAAQAATKK